MGKELERVRTRIHKKEEEIRGKYKAEIVGVFGSYARGEQKKDSDLDILVRFHEGATLFDFVGLANFLEEELQMNVDLVSERAIRKELRERILTEVTPV
ncbi:MAG: nucleotidyltransferase family protein [Euryarchaeota archaeon]|nr:nucleotidyltransferase family protein [Euryarchaeota archaeon]